MTPRSLRLRLLGGSAVWICLALLAAGLAIFWLFTANIERTMRATLVASLNRVVAQIDPFAASPIGDAPLPDPRYATPFSGIYWQVEELGTGITWRSRSLWDFVIDTRSEPAATTAEKLVARPGPENQSLSVLIRDVRFAVADRQVRSFRVVLAENRALLDDSIARFGTELAIALTVLAVALMVAAGLTVQLGLRPLQRIREGIGAVRLGAMQTLPSSYPAEVLPLVAEVNELLEQQQKSIEFARARASDLAHGLKTPLSVLKTLGTALALKGDNENAELLGSLASEMDDRVEYQLRLSRLRLRTRSHRLSASLNEAVERTLAVLARTHDGERVCWQVDMSPGLVADIDRHDLTELVGVLLENAAQWGRTRVRVTGRTEDGMAVLTIADDGPGLTEEQLGRLGQRGQRLDETRRGTGLGLSIGLEIVAINSGEVKFSRAPEGGLEIRVSLRLSNPAQS